MTPCIEKAIRGRRIRLEWSQHLTPPWGVCELLTEPPRDRCRDPADKRFQTLQTVTTHDEREIVTVCYNSDSLTLFCQYGTLTSIWQTNMCAWCSAFNTHRRRQAVSRPITANTPGSSWRITDLLKRDLWTTRLTSGSGYMPSALHVTVTWWCRGSELDSDIDLTGAVKKQHRTWELVDVTVELG